MEYSKATDPDNSNLDSLYKQPIESRRTGPFFNAFSYPTKIDPELVAIFVATHTGVGDTVLDVFGGSGTTGIAAALCDRPTERMLTIASDYGVRPTWGPRRAIIYELSTTGALLGRVMTAPPDPIQFAVAAKELLDTVQAEVGWMYAAQGASGEAGRLRYIIWSEVLSTKCCNQHVSLWDAAVELDPARFRREYVCPHCDSQALIGDCLRVLKTSFDGIIGKEVIHRERIPAWVYGRSGNSTWSRKPEPDDLLLINKVENSPVGPIPSGSVFWGDLHRSGYHTGIDKYHQLYTPRNLRVLSALWRAIDTAPRRVQDALRLLVLSYNATHSTLMTRVVAKKNQRDLVVTGAQSGVLYVSGLPVEKNVLDGVRRKIRIFADAFAQTRGSLSDVEVVNASSTRLKLPNDSVDYLFTDPPFGDFIPYAEVNQINEAWLGRLTDRKNEVIVSPAQNKGVEEYSGLLKKVFKEAARVLRPEGRATVVFHSSKSAVWRALGDAFRSSGFTVERTSILNKSQVSFKQVVSNGGTRGDALFLLRTAAGSAVPLDETEDGKLKNAIELLLKVAGNDPAELEPQRMYSRYVASCIESGTAVRIGAPTFYQMVAELVSENEPDAAATRS